MKGMNLRDVGKEVSLDSLRGQPKVKVVMGIEAPRGKCFMFKSGYGYHRAIDRQGEAIKAFMEQHIND